MRTAGGEQSGLREGDIGPRRKEERETLKRKRQHRTENEEAVREVQQGRKEHR